MKHQIIIELPNTIQCDVDGLQRNGDEAISIAQDWLIACEKEIEQILYKHSSSYGISFPGDCGVTFGLDESAQVYDVDYDDEEDEDLDDEEPEENLFRFG